ncbi:hypothetical protein D018_3060 [Vibrio parahaemolyticus VP2007-007]|nr:hypothetical protein D018_3060 [Vibrio parahaemolyticus VP2007-007]
MIISYALNTLAWRFGLKNKQFEGFGNVVFLIFMIILVI